MNLLIHNFVGCLATQRLLLLSERGWLPLHACCALLMLVADAPAGRVVQPVYYGQVLSAALQHLAARQYVRSYTCSTGGSAGGSSK
jgi:hypothetical protein